MHAAINDDLHLFSIKVFVECMKIVCRLQIHMTTLSIKTPSKSDGEIINDFGETQGTATQKETNQTSNINWKRRCRRLIDYFRTIRVITNKRQQTQNIGKWKEYIPTQLHFRIVDNAPLQVGSQKPDTWTLKWCYHMNDSDWWKTSSAQLT